MNTPSAFSSAFLLEGTKHDPVFLQIHVLLRSKHTMHKYTFLQGTCTTNMSKNCTQPPEKRGGGGREQKSEVRAEKAIFTVCHWT